MLDLEGDSNWDGERRAVIRLDLAKARVELGESEDAHQLLTDARTLG